MTFWFSCKPRSKDQLLEKINVPWWTEPISLCINCASPLCCENSFSQRISGTYVTFSDGTRYENNYNKILNTGSFQFQPWQSSLYQTNPPTKNNYKSCIKYIKQKFKELESNQYKQDLKGYNLWWRGSTGSSATIILAFCLRIFSISCNGWIEPKQKHEFYYAELKEVGIHGYQRIWNLSGKISERMKLQRSSQNLHTNFFQFTGKYRVRCWKPRRKYQLGG